MHVRPLHDRLVVRRIDETEQRVGGIICVVRCSNFAAYPRSCELEPVVPL
jgi:co-chaperonin GroES (HSP10)